LYFETRLITASMSISNLARSLPAKCFSILARSRPRSVSLSSLDSHFQAHLELLRHRLQPVEIYCV
jgi:hypothetical protein